MDELNTKIVNDNDFFFSLERYSDTRMQ